MVIMVYAYLILVAPYMMLWLAFFILRKDIRRKLFFSSAISALLGISEILFILNYWLPQFQTIPIFTNLFVESILFTFFLGGVVSTFYQVLFKEKLFKIRINPLVTLIAPLLFLTYFLNPFRVNIMVYVFTSMFIGSLITMYLGKNSKQIIFSGLINTLFYSIVYFSLWYAFPELPASYQFQNLSGVLIGGIPIEEFLWILSFSFYWTPLYDIWKNNLKRFNFKWNFHETFTKT